MLKLLLAAACFGAFCQTAAAQSAEQTVMYMMQGVTDQAVPIPGDKYNGQIMPLTDKVGANVYTSLLHFSYRTGYHQVDPCRYVLSIDLIDNSKDESKTQEGFKVTIDWSKVSGVRLKNPSVNGDAPIMVPDVQGLTASECQSKDPTACSSDVLKMALGIMINVGSQERINKAYEYFTQNFCKGSAF